jgi:hypothetical protein
VASEGKVWPESGGEGVSLSKVVLQMPQVTPVIGAQEHGAAFEAQIVNATNVLVDNAYRGHRHGQVNRILELAGVLCQPRQVKAIKWDLSRSTRAVSKKCWCSFGYNYVLGAICTKLREVTTNH